MNQDRGERKACRRWLWQFQLSEKRRTFNETLRKGVTLRRPVLQQTVSGLARQPGIWRLRRFTCPEKANPGRSSCDGELDISHPVGLRIIIFASG